MDENDSFQMSTRHDPNTICNTEKTEISLDETFDSRSDTSTVISHPPSPMPGHTLLIIPRAENLGHEKSLCALTSSAKVNTDESSQKYIIFNTGVGCKDHTSIIREENVESWFGKKSVIVLEKIDHQYEKLLSLTDQNDSLSTFGNFFNGCSLLQEEIKIEQDSLGDQDSRGLHAYPTVMDSEGLQESGTDTDNEFDHFHCSELVSFKLEADESIHEPVIESHESHESILGQVANTSSLDSKTSTSRIRKRRFRTPIYSTKKVKRDKMRRRLKKMAKLHYQTEAGEILLSESSLDVPIIETKVPITESMNENSNEAMFDTSSNEEYGFINEDETDTVGLSTETVYLAENPDIKEEENSETESCDSHEESTIVEPSVSYPKTNRIEVYKKPELHIDQLSFLKRFECCHCGKKFLMDRRRIPTRKDPYICPLCSLTSAPLISVPTHNSGLENVTMKLFQCAFCDKRYARKHALTEHIRTHTGAKPYSCHICKVSFYKGPLLKRHLRIHAMENPFKCTICNDIFLKRYMLNQHMKTHEADASTEPFLNATIPSENAPKSSSRTHDLHEPPLACRFCDLKFSEESTLKSHFRTHNHECSHACTYCLAKFKEKSLLAEHVKTHIQEYPCAICDFKCPTKSGLNTHMRWHSRSHNCSDCGLKFTKKRDFHKHRKSHISESSFVKRISPSEMPITCSVCSASFFNERKLNDHLRTHLEKSPPDGDKFACVFCFLKFREGHLLNEHLKTHLAKFPCQHCDLKLATRAALTEHEETHFNKISETSSVSGKFSENSHPSANASVRLSPAEMAFVCVFCKTTFSDVCSLRDHLKTHRTKFPCVHCDLKFSTEAALDEHIKIHAEEAFACVFCNTKFSKECSLDDHLKTHLDKYACVHCDLKFTTEAALDEHIKIHLEVNSDHLLSGNVRSPKVLDPLEALETSISASSDVCSASTVGQFACVFCCGKFSEESVLNEHLKIHLNKFPCAICNRPFATKASLGKHLKTHSEVKTS